MNIAMTILKIRKDKKMTQEEFAKLAHLELSNDYTLDSEGNIISGKLSKRDKVTYYELKAQIALMTKKSLELFDQIYGQSK